uniref:Uncharacterized protein n=1 Tax=Anopheles minimus TaxID=112268 RepID=A0A182WPY4_9DIPT
MAMLFHFFFPIMVSLFAVCLFCSLTLLLSLHFFNLFYCFASFPSFL